MSLAVTICGFTFVLNRTTMKQEWKTTQKVKVKFSIEVIFHSIHVSHLKKMKKNQSLLLHS